MSGKNRVFPSADEKSLPLQPNRLDICPTLLPKESYEVPTSIFIFLYTAKRAKI
jgi:hypothetical protein